jgi:hypothetical protein
MNTILQKRIEEAAEKYAYTNWENDDYHEGAEEGMPFDPIGYLEKCFKKAATFALQNQWISVEEALPKYDEAVIGMDYIPKLDWDDQTIIFVHRSDNPNVVTDKNKFCVYPPTFRKVTHWMIIPSLEGGEK